MEPRIQSLAKKYHEISDNYIRQAKIMIGLAFFILRQADLNA
jgi:hypothetical protein